MSKKNRRVFSASEKSRVALAALRETQTINEIAAERGVHPTQVREWKKQLLEGLPTVFEDGRSRASASDDSEKREQALYEQIGRLKMEVEFLRKQVRL
jgi:transposase-like protein